MKKLVIAALAAILVLAGCASTEPAAETTNQTAAAQVGQVLGMNGVPMPDWVFSDQSTQDVHFAVGYAKMSNQMNSMKRAQALLSGTKQEDMWIDAEGGVYILMSIPVENVASQMYGAASDAVGQSQFVKNEAAAEANEMMNAAIDKYFGSVSVTE